MFGINKFRIGHEGCKSFKVIISLVKQNYKMYTESRFGGPEVLEVDSEVKVPEISDDQVLVRVMYAGVNPVETYIREGQYSK